MYIYIYIYIYSIEIYIIIIIIRKIIRNILNKIFIYIYKIFIYFIITILFNFFMLAITLPNYGSLFPPLYIYIYIYIYFFFFKKVIATFYLTIQIFFSFICTFTSRNSDVFFSEL